MSVTRTPRDIARRLGAQGQRGADGRIWETFALTGLDARGGARLWFNLNSSQGNQLISRYLAERLEKADQRSASELGDDAASARHQEIMNDE